MSDSPAAFPALCWSALNLAETVPAAVEADAPALHALFPSDLAEAA